MTLTETQRLRIRQKLVNDPDLELDPVICTAISYLLSPVVAEMLDEERRVTPARSRRRGVSGW